MQLSDWQQADKIFNYKNHRIFYREEGSGETLLLLHGFPTASWDWHKIWQPLARQFHLLAPDMIGFGFSAKPRQYTYSIFDQADLFEVMTEKMGIRQAHLLAHDYGDTVAQELLARWLDRQGNYIQGLEIQSITLLNGGIFSEMHRPRLIQKMLASPAGSLLTPLFGKGQLRRTFREIFGKNSQPTEAEIDQFWQLIEHNNGKALLPRLIGYMNERRKNRERWVGALQRSPLPICHINGTDDPISGQHSGEYFQKMVPQARVNFLSGIGHYPQVEAPDLTLKHLLALLESD